MAARHFVLVSDAVAPLASGEAPLGVVGLGRALVGSGSSATVLSLAEPGAAATIPGLARRLRTVKVLIGDAEKEVSLYEGKAPLSQAQLVVAGASGAHRGESALLLAETARALVDVGLLKADVVVAWGETAAPVLAVLPAVARLFVVPSGRVGSPLSDGELAAIEKIPGLAEAGGRSLAAVGAAFANAIVAPSPSAARQLESDPGFAERASDEPLIAVRFGCDDPPHDPATDSALPVTFSVASMAGKLECRRALTKRYSLALGPRTLLLGCGQLRPGKGGEEVLAALADFGKLDVVTVVPGDGDTALLDKARRLAIQSPGRLAILEPGDVHERLLRAAADAIIQSDPDDRTARAAGLAQRYGALPIALDAGAARDHLVDCDIASGTGTAILFDAPTPYDIEAAVRRAVMLRSAGDLFTPLVRRMMETAPRWSQTAAAIEEISSAFG